MKTKNTVNIVTLGCSKNVVDSEFLMKQLAGAYRRQIDLLQRAVRMPAEV